MRHFTFFAECRSAQGSSTVKLYRERAMKRRLEQAARSVQWRYAGETIMSLGQS